MNSVAEKIRAARSKAGISEKALAKKCGLSESYIKQIETGKKVINEQAAQKIFQVLGVDADLLQQGSRILASDVKPTQTTDLDRKKQRVKQENISIEPNEQWSDALAHIIKQFPVIDLLSGKTIGIKEVPVLGKKIEECQWNKIRFFRVSDNLLAHLRIKSDDIVMVCETEEIINGKLMAFEMNGRCYLRKMWKNKKKLLISTGLNNEEPVEYDAEKVRVIGQCLKVEFKL